MEIGDREVVSRTSIEQYRVKNLRMFPHCLKYDFLRSLEITYFDRLPLDPMYAWNEGVLLQHVQISYWIAPMFKSLVYRISTAPLDFSTMHSFYILL